MRSKDRRKGFRCLGMWIVGNESQRFHVYHVRGRIRMCDCGRDWALKDRLGISLGGYRSIAHNHTRNNTLLLELRLEEYYDA